MPIYEYRCASCGNDFELSRSFSQSSDPANCPTCGKPAQKLVSAFASKADYTVKLPAKEPFRAPAAASAGTKATAPKSSAPKASAPKAAGTKGTAAAGKSAKGTAKK